MDRDELTRLLEASRAGEHEAAERLLPLLYDELRELARVRLSRERPDHTLQPTALVHEAWMRLLKPRPTDDPPAWDSRAHFFASAAEAMRRVLVDAARRRGRLKRGANAVRVTLDPDLVPSPSQQPDLLALEEALSKLEGYDERKGRVVVLRYFAGLSIDETASALGVSPATVKADWSYARAYLHRELAAADAEGP